MAVYLVRLMDSPSERKCPRAANGRRGSRYVVPRHARERCVKGPIPAKDFVCIGRSDKFGKGLATAGDERVPL